MSEISYEYIPRLNWEDLRVVNGVRINRGIEPVSITDPDHLYAPLDTNVIAPPDDLRIALRKAMPLPYSAGQAQVIQTEDINKRLLEANQAIDTMGQIEPHSALYVACRHPRAERLYLATLNRAVLTGKLVRSGPVPHWEADPEKPTLELVVRSVGKVGLLPHGADIIIGNPYTRIT